MEERSINSNNKRYYIYFGVAILMLALVFGAGVSNWMGSGSLWAAQDAQEAPTQLVRHSGRTRLKLPRLRPARSCFRSFIQRRLRPLSAFR